MEVESSVIGSMFQYNIPDLSSKVSIDQDNDMMHNSSSVHADNNVSDDNKTGISVYA